MAWFFVGFICHLPRVAPRTAARSGAHFEASVIELRGSVAASPSSKKPSLSASTAHRLNASRECADSLLENQRHGAVQRLTESNRQKITENMLALAARKQSLVVFIFRRVVCQIFGGAYSVGSFLAFAFARCIAFITNPNCFPLSDAISSGPISAKITSTVRAPLWPVKARSAFFSFIGFIWWPYS